MSTYIYLRCLDHIEHAARSEDVGQHLWNLDQVRMDYALRPAIIAGIAAEMCFYGDHFRSNTADFFIDHPACRLDVVDEYGQAHSLEQDQP